MIDMSRRTQFAVSLLACLALASSASADLTLNFYQLTDNGNGVNVGSQLSVLVSSSDKDGNALAGQVRFRFENAVGTPSSIADVYFDDGALLGIATIDDSGAGVSFDDPASPGNLPGGELANPDFVATAGFSADSEPPVEANGVDAAGEWLDITFNLVSGMDYDDVVSALANPSGGDGEGLRIGLHVQAIGDVGGSDSYINTPVPVPAAVLLGAIGLPLAGVIGRRLNCKGSRAPKPVLVNPRTCDSNERSVCGAH